MESFFEEEDDLFTRPRTRVEARKSMPPPPAPPPPPPLSQTPTPPPPALRHQDRHKCPRCKVLMKTMGGQRTCPCAQKRRGNQVYPDIPERRLLVINSTNKVLGEVAFIRGMANDPDRDRQDVAALYDAIRDMATYESPRSSSEDSDHKGAVGDTEGSDFDREIFTTPETSPPCHWFILEDWELETPPSPENPHTRDTGPDLQNGEAAGPTQPTCTPQNTLLQEGTGPPEDETAHRTTQQGTRLGGPPKMRRKRGDAP